VPGAISALKTLFEVSVASGLRCNTPTLGDFHVLISGRTELEMGNLRKHCLGLTQPDTRVQWGYVSMSPMSNGAK
jgi:hypothetical protein